MTFHTSSLPTKQWEFVCEVRHVDCSDIPPPIIVPIIPDPNLYGLFEPSLSPDVIFVEPGLGDTMTEVVTMHEASHYLDWKTGALYRNEYDWYPVEVLCKSEEMGYNVANIWVAYKGYDQNYARYDWIEYYPHCQEWLWQYGIL